MNKNPSQLLPIPSGLTGLDLVNAINDRLRRIRPTDVASSTQAGPVKPDGTSIVVDPTGTISTQWMEEVPTGTLDGTNKVFTISKQPIPSSLTLFVNIDQREGTDFTISGKVITFTVAPKARDAGWFFARYQY